ncbi:peptide deformylase [Spirochaeta thermophila]|uniref:Peptide deformylase n=1 Tax=Winmispira thermophila (strain ATCC 49972 / DSM 6192 / RI 19.B1) TaxID=665571 RepID=E0RQR7_WINT6|nr:peptide deformylase [Spirochaeta thermophila]ADN02973.1 peptide deformylase [Spirochaeta thermophila DSM 6192]
MELRYLGDEILRKRAVLVPEIDGRVARVVEGMFDLMHEANGIGLAAPQVGISQRFFICHVPEGEPLVFINPEITATSPELTTFEEGCLSIPQIYADVVRPAAVEVSAWNLQGKPFRMEADGMLARVIQHEFDHLNGVLFLDRLPSKKRERLEQLYWRRTRVAR